ncbi:transcription factor SPT20 homolog [Clupea harengus]|uniref:Transcription factor SPT20 homolog n=1 Tax=Clupea harengus TaxID=7950 RepID=A0A6P8FJC3_CLUHA|nr:transcription factor SPT20 homolog [Clupea harengus]
MWKQSTCQLTVPSEIDVEKYAVVEKSVKIEESQPTVWPAQDIKDDYIFECEVSGQTQKTKVTIFQSVGDPMFHGKIYSAKDSKCEEEGPDLHLIHPPFLIGSKIDADRFLKQYKEVYERDVKCPVKMSHNSGNSVSQGQLSPTRETETDTFSGLMQSSVLGKGVKHRPPPIKLTATSTSSSGNPYISSQTSGGPLKCPTPPPAKNQSLTRKHSMDQIGLLSPSALSPMGSSQRSGTPKPLTPTPTNTPCSTPHPTDTLNATPSVTPTPHDTALAQPPTLLAPFAQQQMALSQALPVMTIPLPTSISTGTTSSQVMANPAGLNFINVVGSVCPQTLMGGSNPMLSCSPGINLSGILPPGGLMSGTLPTMQSTAQAGSPFSLNNSPGLRPLNLLQIPTGPLIFNPLQQQQLSQFSPQQQNSQSATSSPQQQGEPADQSGNDQGLGAQQTAVINLTGVGGFMSSQAAVLSQLACGLDGSGPSLPSPRLQQQQQQRQQHHQPQIQLQFLRHQMHQQQQQQQQQQMAMAAGAAVQVGLPAQHSANQARSKRKRSTP